MKHFLKDSDFSATEAAEIFSLAQTFKKQRLRHGPPCLDRQTWAMLFFKNSTRTRVSFEVGIRELGGHPLILDQRMSQMGRDESIADTARVLSRYVHGIIIRTFGQEIIDEFARWSSVPVVNALTDEYHPCQIFADAFTIAEHFGGGSPALPVLEGRKVAFLGDCAFNMANSWILGGALFGLEVALAGPAEMAPRPLIDEALQTAGLPRNYRFTTDPAEAVAGADVVYTDVWVSMGQDEETAQRLETLRPYSVNEELMKLAKPDAVFMHCLPAHPGHEVSEPVYEGPQSIVWDQAENRLHIQKAILAVLAEANR